MSTPERTLLHDMVNKLTVAQGKVRRVLRGKSENQEVDLEKASNAIDDTVELIKQLRQVFIDKEEVS